MSNTTILKILLIIGLLLFPMIIFAQETQTENQGEAINLFLKGNGFLEEWFMDAFRHMQTNIDEYTGSISLWAKFIGATGLMIYMGVLGWRMQAGEPWSVQPFIKPFIMTIIILNWVQFTKVINYPLDAMSFPANQKFEQMKQRLNNVQNIRTIKQFEVYNKATQLRAEARVAQSNAENGNKNIIDKTLDWFGEKTNALISPVVNYASRLEFLTQRLIGDLMEMASMACLRICVYIIYLVQKLWLYTLALVGPIAVAFSFIPGFENSFNNWLAKYINISLWGFIGMVMILLGQAIIEASFEMEIDRLNQMINEFNVNTDNPELLITYINGNGFLFGRIFIVVAYIISGIGMLFVPKIADSIISAGGAGIMNGTFSPIGKIANIGKRVIATTAKAVATGGASAAVDIPKQSLQALQQIAKNTSNGGNGGSGGLGGWRGSNNPKSPR